MSLGLFLGVAGSAGVRLCTRIQRLVEYALHLWVWGSMVITDSHTTAEAASNVSIGTAYFCIREPWETYESKQVPARPVHLRGLCTVSVTTAASMSPSL